MFNRKHVLGSLSLMFISSCLPWEMNPLRHKNSDDSTSGESPQPTNEQTPESGGQTEANQQSGSSQRKPAKRPGNLTPKSFDELAKMVLPSDFVDGKLDPKALSVRLSSVSKLAADRNKSWLQRPIDWGDTDRSSKPIVDGPCKTIDYSNAFHISTPGRDNIDSALDDLAKIIANEYPTTMEPKMHSDATKVIEAIDKTVFGYQSDWKLSDGKLMKESAYYIGANGDWIFLAVSGHRPFVSEEDFLDESLYHCAYGINDQTKEMKSACSSASWTALYTGSGWSINQSYLQSQVNESWVDGQFTQQRIDLHEGVGNYSNPFVGLTEKSQFKQVAADTMDISFDFEDPNLSAIEMNVIHKFKSVKATVKFEAKDSYLDTKCKIKALATTPL
jgi:hypothetical protein